jgi:hypothetical protein
LIGDIGTATTTLDELKATLTAILDAAELAASFSYFAQPDLLLGRLYSSCSQLLKD